MAYKLLLCVLFLSVSLSAASKNQEGWAFEFSPNVGEHRTQFISYSPDGKIFATADRENISIWSAKGYVLRTLSQKYLNGIKFSSSGKFLGAYDNLKHISLWDPVSGQLFKKITFPDINWTQVITSVDFNPTDSLLAAAVSDSIKVWAIDQSTATSTVYRAHGRKGIHAIYFADDGKALVTGTLDGSIKIWDVFGHNIRTFEAGEITDFYVHKAGREIVCASPERIAIWGLDGQLISEFNIDTSLKFVDAWRIMGTKLHPVNVYKSKELVAMPLNDSNSILVLSNRGLQAWEKSGKLLWESHVVTEEKEIYGIPRINWAVAPAPDGANIAIGSPGGLELWSVAGKGPKWVYSPNYLATSDFEIFPGTNIITSSMRLFDLTGKIVNDYSNNEIGSYLSASPDGNLLAVAYSSGTVKLYDRYLELQHTFFTNHLTPLLSFSPDSKKLIMLHQNERSVSAIIRDVTGGEVLSEIPLPGGIDPTVKYHP